MQQFSGVFQNSNNTWQASGTIEIVAGQPKLLKVITRNRDHEIEISGHQLEPLPHHIYGVLTNGKKITLPEAIIKGRQLVLGNQIGVVTFLCPRVLIGSVSFPEVDFSFNAFSVELQWLDDWVKRPNVLAPFFLSPRNAGVLLRYQRYPKEIMTVTSISETFEIVLDKRSFLNGKRGVYQTNESAQFVIIPRETKTLAWFEEQQRLLWLLIGLLSGRDVQIRQQRGIVQPISKSAVVPSAKEFTWPDAIPSQKRTKLRSTFDPLCNDFEIVQSRVVNTLEESSDEKLLTNRLNSPELSTILQHWFQKPKLAAMAGLLLAATRKDDYYIESRLANLAQALEAMHRFLYPERTKFLTKAEMRAIRESLKEHWPVEVAEEYKQQVVNSLNNNVSFRTRLTELFEEAWLLISKYSDFENPQQLAKAVEDLRNPISHGSLIRLEKPIPVANLARMLAQVLRYYLLKELGWSPEALLEQIASFENIEIDKADFEY